MIRQYSPKANKEMAQDALEILLEFMRLNKWTKYFDVQTAGFVSVPALEYWQDCLLEMKFEISTGTLFVRVVRAGKEDWEQSYPGALLRLSEPERSKVIQEIASAM